MCSSKSKSQDNCNRDGSTSPTCVNKRRVLQPNCNRVPSLERPNSPLKKTATAKVRPPSSTATATTPVSPKLKSPRLPAIKRSNDLNSSIDRLIVTPKSSNIKASSAIVVKKSKKSSGIPQSGDNGSLKCSSSSLIVEAPGSIAAARREQVAIMQEQRKLRIAHYGRTKSIKKVVPDNNNNNHRHHSSSVTNNAAVRDQEKRCTFITPNSDPIYVTYHDEEWGVPVHDDKLLFELLVLIGAQVGSDWTSVLKKRQDLRDAFSGFDAEIVSKFSEKKINSINTDCGIDLSQVRGVVDNSNRILEIKKEFGSFEKYVWRFVNNKPIATKYKSCHKIPVKTSKSESISKDMVRRGFRLVGPTIIHSFMQAAGLSNDHLITCPRHYHCVQVAQASFLL
ncbi:dual specificity kinase splA-like [Olea europaea subsp. europaea]|uniref:Dual specificity kinase splA-like n=1 Tax=Olea europaea subsp. europaea TaxID=158383 RepID=A0A8S0V0N0_OLEEU|nr:dual specificity kinase splA-like [Olea europaea subsp. europaea]